LNQKINKPLRSIAPTSLPRILGDFDVFFGPAFFFFCGDVIPGCFPLLPAYFVPTEASYCAFLL